MDGRARHGGGGLLVPLFLAVLCALAVGVFAIHFRSYYRLPVLLRRQSPLHNLLRPAGLVGLASGILAALLFVWNGAFLIRRSKLGRRAMPGGRRKWMNWHVFTGLTSVPLALIHSAFAIRNSVAGHALIVLGLVVISGSAGRFLFARLARSAPRGETRARRFLSWRFVHVWLALLLILLVAIHIGVSLRYASFGPPPNQVPTEVSR